jgi:hypothetical protein
LLWSCHHPECVLSPHSGLVAETFLADVSAAEIPLKWSRQSLL